MTDYRTIQRLAELEHTLTYLSWRVEDDTAHAEILKTIEHARNTRRALQRARGVTVK